MQFEDVEEESVDADTHSPEDHTKDPIAMATAQATPTSSVGTESGLNGILSEVGKGPDRCTLRPTSVVALDRKLSPGSRPVRAEPLGRNIARRRSIRRSGKSLYIEEVGQYTINCSRCFQYCS